MAAVTGPNGAQRAAHSRGNRIGAPVLERAIPPTLVALTLLALFVHDEKVPQARGASTLVLASGPTVSATATDALSPEERMRRRYPQPVKVGDLIGLPVLDDRDRTLGRVQRLVRAPNGKIRLIVSYGGPFRLEAAADRRADRGGGYCRPSTCCPRHDEGAVRRRAHLERH